MQLRLKELCDKKEVTLYQLANEMNIDRNTVYAWANNKIFPRVKQLDKLLEFFGCEVQDLIVKN
jgi:transcriptional regulator with XRE-family HTH domain